MTTTTEVMQSAIIALAESQTKTNDLLAKILAPPPAYRSGEEFTGRGGLHEQRKGGPPLDVRERRGQITLFDTGGIQAFGTGSGDEVATVACVVRAIFDEKSPEGRAVEIDFDGAGEPVAWLQKMYDHEHSAQLAEARRPSAFVGGDPVAFYENQRAKWVNGAFYFRVRLPILRCVGKPIGAIRGLVFDAGSTWTPIAGSSGARAAEAAGAE